MMEAWLEGLGRALLVLCSANIDRVRREKEAERVAVRVT